VYKYKDTNSTLNWHKEVFSSKEILVSSINSNENENIGLSKEGHYFIIIVLKT